MDKILTGVPPSQALLMYFCRCFTSLFVLAVLAPCTVVGLDNRVPNTTLTVPEVPQQFGYQVVNAFPGLSFDKPVALVSQPGETNRLFVVEQAGKIYVITNLASPSKTLFLDISSKVETAASGYSEEGLLGLVFHPNWRANRYFFVFYNIQTTTTSGTGRHDRLARFQIDSADPNTADISSEQPLYSQYDRAIYHNAGDLHFGTDGYLYVSTGDEGGARDAGGNSRVINKNFFSAILRLDVDRQPGSIEPNPHPAIHTDAQGQAYYAIPPDNPFIGTTSHNGKAINPDTVRTEIWATGLRNPWRFSFDPQTGTLFCGDVGQSGWEEINVIVKGGDYGWEYREGAHPHIDNDGDDTVPPGVTLIDPILEYPNFSGPTIPGGKAEGRSVIGGIVYTGSRFAQLSGMYVFGDYYNSRMFALRYDTLTGAVSDFQQLATASPVAFVADPGNGDVLFAHLAGTIYRLIYSTTPTQGQPLPPLLSGTGAFASLATLDPQPGIVPYELNVPFWSDHALKSRWFSIPDVNDSLTFSATGNWSFPSGTVWIKHFDLEITNGVPASRRRLETRFLVKNDDGVHGFTYKWNAGQTDADLVPEGGENEAITVYQLNGDVLRQQVWQYPSRGECLQCHTAVAGHALGFHTVQLNRAHDYGTGPANQIAALSTAGYFDSPVTDIPSLPALSRPDETAVSLEHRVRSYLQANCVQCHQPGGPSQGGWDARITTATASAGLINGPLVNDLGDPANRVLVPSDTVHSVLLQKLSTRGPGQMPPIASSIADPAGTALLTEWIAAGLPTGNLIAPEINWATPAAIGYGTALGPAQLNAAANVPGTFSYDPPAGTVLSAGNSQTLTVLFMPTDTATYSSAQASVSINVTPAALTITAENKSRTYGAVNPALTASYAGFVNGETATVLDSPVSLSTVATAASPVGSYAITASGAADANYTITHVNGTLAVTRAPLTITAENKTKIEDQPNPPLTAVYNSFVNGETPASLDSPAVLSTTALVDSPPGQYPITVAGAADTNYQISFVAGTLTVEANALFVPLELGQGNRVTLQVTGHPGRAYRVQVSPDLEAWEYFTTITTDSVGVGTHAEASDPPPGNRYFRILWP
jgi:uncharacterized repeat protein (TIGR03806 family)